MRGFRSNLMSAIVPPNERAVYDFATELFETQQVCDTTCEEAKRLLGERWGRSVDQRDGLVRDGVDVPERRRYPLPEGAQAALKPLR